MCEEADGAVEYAQKVSLFSDKPKIKAMYSEMAHDEIKHAEYLYEIGKTMISENSSDMSKDAWRSWERAIKHLADVKHTVSLLLDEAGTVK